jgi:transposase
MEALIAENTSLKQENIELRSATKQLTEQLLNIQDQLVKMQRLVFGQSRERFISSGSSDQLNLFSQQSGSEASEVVSAPQERTEQISYERRKAVKSNHQGRQLLSQCTHLPVEEQILEPVEDIVNLTKIGEQVSEKLAFKPGRLYIKKYVRPKYLDKQTEKIIIADPISEPLPRCEADVSLLAHLLVSKFVDHLPEYRQIEIFKRENVNIPSSTLNDWIHGSAKLLGALTNIMQSELLSSGYVQADETTIKVLDGSKKGQTHLGYIWTYYGPEKKIVVFDYHKGRGREGPQEMLGNYQGYLQTDGYEVYDTIVKDNASIVHVGCMAHARRYFEQALKNDKERAEYVLERIQFLYLIEEALRGAKMNADQRVEKRRASIDVLKEIKEFLDKAIYEVGPKSLIGKAVRYMSARMDKLMVYTTNGRVEIDNNLIENKIRPIALGRKNYLFAGSHDAAKRIAIIYTILGTCKANSINPYEYLVWVLNKIADTKASMLYTLTPQSYKQNTSQI